MEELIKTFHIDGTLILAQLVNFAIVLFVLYKFAYGPILKMMTERTDKINKGIEDAENATRRLTEITEKEEAVLVEARKQARDIVAGAEELAMKNKDEIIIIAKGQAEKILTDSARRIEDEKKQMIQEVKGQLVDLVIFATGKLIDTKIDSEKDKELISKAIREKNNSIESEEANAMSK